MVTKNNKKHNGLNGPRNGAGRPPKTIDWSLIDRLANIQCTQDEIAYAVNISEKTLQTRCKVDKHCSLSEYISKQTGVGKVSLRRWMWAKAESGNVTMLIWLSKNILGYADKQEVTGDRGEPITLKVIYDTSDKASNSPSA